MGGMLSKKPHDPNPELPVTAPTNETDLSDISFKAGFHSLSLDDVSKITGLRLETNEEAMKMMIESKKHTWNNKNLTQAFQDYFTITSKLLLWRTKNEEESVLKDCIQESKSLEQKLRAHYTKISGRKKKTYLLLQSVASIFAMVPLIGPLYVTLYLKNNYDEAERSVLLSIGYLAAGAIGNYGVWFWQRKRNTLGVQEKLMGPLLMSMVFRNKDLNGINRFLNDGPAMQSPEFNAAICKLEERLRSDRNLVLQKLSGQNESTSPDLISIRTGGLDTDNSNPDRTVDY